jgi:hypothetical protein
LAMDDSEQPNASVGVNPQNIIMIVETTVMILLYLTPSAVGSSP